MMIDPGCTSSKVIRRPRGFRGKIAVGRACRRPPAGLRLPRAMPDATIHTHGRVLETLGPVLYRVVLPNGKIILAHGSKRLADAKTVFAPDDRLLLEFTPYDFDTARILGPAERHVSLADAEAAENHA